MQEIEHTSKFKPLKAPSNKVPAVNLPKLAFDKKVVPIIVSACKLVNNCINSWT